MALLLWCSSFNTLADVSRRQVQNVTKSSQNVKFLEFHYYIWNHHGKYIQKSTNMPGFALVSNEIGFRIQEFREQRCYHATGLSRRQVQNVTKNSQNVKFLEFHYYVRINVQSVLKY